jgi:hypothetical protein
MKRRGFIKLAGITAAAVTVASCSPKSTEALGPTATLQSKAILTPNPTDTPTTTSVPTATATKTPTDVPAATETATVEPTPEGLVLASICTNPDDVLGVDGKLTETCRIKTDDYKVWLNTIRQKELKAEITPEQWVFAVANRPEFPNDPVLYISVPTSFLDYMHVYPSDPNGVQRASHEEGLKAEEVKVNMKGRLVLLVDVNMYSTRDKVDGFINGTWPDRLYQITLKITDPKIYGSYRVGKRGACEYVQNQGENAINIVNSLLGKPVSKGFIITQEIMDSNPLLVTIFS